MNRKNDNKRNELPTLGEQVRRWRITRNITQAGLEEKAGLSHNAVSRIECGSVSPRLETLDRISQVLGVTIEQLQFQSPSSTVAESQIPFESDEGIVELIALLEKIPEPAKSRLLGIFKELARMTSGECDG